MTLQCGDIAVSKRNFDVRVVDYLVGIFRLLQSSELLPGIRFPFFQMRGVTKERNCGRWFGDRSSQGPNLSWLNGLGTRSAKRLADQAICLEANSQLRHVSNLWNTIILNKIVVAGDVLVAA